jgi:hypothetical protein
MISCDIALKTGKVLYLEPGKQNINCLIEAVSEKIETSGVSKVVVASMTGINAIKFAESLKGKATVFGVTEFTYSDEVKKKMKKLGVIPLEKVDLPIQDRKEMRQALTIFGDGVKAAIEVATIVGEKSLSPEKIVAVAGGKGGLDTALVIKPSPLSSFFDPDPKKRFAIIEIISMPVNDYGE